MLYLYLKKDFTAITESAGIIQNLSPFTLEVSTTNEPDSGFPILPHQDYFFDEPVYVRCVDGTAKARVITAGVNSLDADDMNYSCCPDVCCDGSAKGEQAGIAGVILDDVVQSVNDDNYVVLDLSDYFKGGDESIIYSEIAKLFR